MLRTVTPLAALALLTVSACAKTAEAPKATDTSMDELREGDAGKSGMEAINLTGNLRRIRFDSGSAALDRLDKVELDRAARILKANPSVRIVAVGHTDTSGSPDDNIALGLERARAVETYLEAQGVAPSRVASASAGESSPLIDPEIFGTTRATTWAMNRRVEFHVAWDPNDAVDGSRDNFPAGAMDAAADAGEDR